MNKKEPKEIFALLVPIYPIVMLSLIFGFFSLWYGVGFFFSCVCLWFLFLAISSAGKQSDEWRGKRAHQKKYGRLIAKRKAAANLHAQLNKPDFDTRLQNFVGAHEAAEQEAEVEPEYVSKAKFWQLENYFYEETPSRPIEFLRYLLQRISKLVGQGRTEESKQ